jgi:uncharacterized membrane protein YjdF
MGRWCFYVAKYTTWESWHCSIEIGGKEIGTYFIKGELWDAQREILLKVVTLISPLMTLQRDAELSCFLFKS